MILLVEDEYMVRELVADSLKNYGYQVIEACNGVEAKEKMIKCQRPIDLVLTDVVMPGISGKQLIDELSKIQPNLKSIFMSGYTNDAIANNGILENNVAFIQKPFSPTNLIHKVQEVLAT
ncbi:MAG: response regulator [Calditrichaceae bacterium]